MLQSIEGLILFLCASLIWRDFRAENASDIGATSVLGWVLV